MMRFWSKLSLLFFISLSLNAFANTDSEKLNALKVVGKVLIHSSNKSPYSLHEGDYQIDEVKEIFALNDGQVIFKLGSDKEFRLKEDSNIQISNLGKAEISRGMAGFNFKEEPHFIKTPHFEVTGNNCVFVIKANPIITRICVIKGKVEVKKLGEYIQLNADEEIAASDARISKKYSKSAELRFAWYWVEPEKEPSFQ